MKEFHARRGLFVPRCCVRGGRRDHVEPAVVVLATAEAVVPLVGPHVVPDAVFGLQEEVERPSPPVSRR